MRYLLTLLLLSLLFFSPVVSYGWGVMMLGGGGSEAYQPSNCGGTQTFVGAPGDTETFEYQADDFCCTEFSVTDPDGIISTYDSTQVKNGTYAASFAFTGSGAENDNWIKVDLGSTDSDYSNDFWFWPHKYNDSANYIMAVATSDDDSASASWGYRLKHVHSGASDWKLQGVGDGESLDTSIALSAEAWYRIEVDFNQGGITTIEIYNSSDVLQDTLSFTARNIAPRYLFWGCILADGDARSTNYIDDIRFKSGGGGF